MIYGQPVVMGGGTFVTAVHNTDGTQNLVITDKKPDGSIIDVPAPATLLWENSDYKSEFVAQKVDVESGYAGYFVELRSTAGNSLSNSIVSLQFIPAGESKLCFATGVYTSDGRDTSGYQRYVSTGDGYVNFYGGYVGVSQTEWDSCAIPTRIWGVKFNLPGYANYLS